jgi:hypothetical protein
VPGPDYMCVPRFLSGGIHDLLGAQVLVETLAIDLGVRVPQGADNQLGLSVTMDQDDTGVTARQTSDRFPVIARTLSEPIMFRHIPFREIVFDLYWDAINELLKSRVVVGLGLNLGYFSQSGVCRHVSRVQRLTQDVVEFEDECLKSVLATSTLPVQVVECAVLDIYDGIWTVARQEGWPHGLLGGAGIV